MSGIKVVRLGYRPPLADYRIYHGATLMIDIEDGRLVLFCLPVTV
jgi:hypothetical protein